MVQTEAFFGAAIRPVLLREIGLARHTIHAAVAWFTDPALFAALLERQRAGVAVALAVADDATINLRPGGLPFGELTAAGGQFWAVAGALMHHKFCVLDGRDLLTGSYNWTRTAAVENQENIVLISSNHELARKFIAEFRILTGQAPSPAAILSSLDRAYKIVDIIRLSIELGETDDLNQQINRLTAASSEPQIQAIVEILRSRRLTEAVQRISELLVTARAVQVWDDPRVPALRLEIQLLEIELVALTNERTEIEYLIHLFHQIFTCELGELLEQVLWLRRELAARRRQESAYAETEYQQAQRRYAEQCRQREAAETAAAQTFELDAPARADMKKMYREAVWLCHTDRVAEPQKAAATAAFQALQHAYERQDAAAVEAQLYDLRRGNFTSNAIMLVDVSALTAKRDLLHYKKTDLLGLLESIRKTGVYPLATDEAAATAYLATTKTQLEAELTTLRRQYEQPA